MTTANLLKAVNSAYFARSTPFDSVQQAIVFLGMDEVVNLVLMAGSAANLNRAQEGYGLATGDLWRNAVTSALISRKLCQRLKIVNEHLVFTGALLKDIGKVVLEQYVAKSAEAIHILVKQKRLSFQEAEKQVLGIDHTELGAITAEVWRFSPAMVDMIRYHHQPAGATVAKKETFAVHLSDLVCMMMGIGTGYDGLAYRFDQSQIKTMGVTDRDLQSIMADIAQKIEDIDALVATV
jgi:putative nucleotidyltransferase with HDIG domain